MNEQYVGSSFTNSNEQYAIHSFSGILLNRQEIRVAVDSNQLRIF